MISAHNWYNLNSTRRYPIDDGATGETDNGVQAPDDILLDCHLRFPSTAGAYAFVGSLHCTPNLISATFQSATHPARFSDCGIGDSSSSLHYADGDFTPLAAISLPRSTFEPYRQYPVSPMYEGAGGWVVFGEGLRKGSFSGKFSTVEQSMLLPKTCRPYAPLPVTSMARINNRTKLRGLVKILGGTDVEVVVDERQIAGGTKDVLIIRLNSTNSAINALKAYTGPCAGRPESNTCGMPVVEALNSVLPDCNGNINIVFQDTHGCTYVGHDVDGGMVVDFCLDLDLICEQLLSDNYRDRDLCEE